MKRLLLFVAFLLPVSFLLAQKTYDAQWRNVDALIQKKNLPKSALVIVKKIYAAAKAEGNEVQAMKALVYRIDLQEETRENNEQAAIAEVKSELLNSREPFASLLNSLLAGLYLRLFEEHRWQLYNRSKTENADTADITKWSIADFHQTIGRLYLLSIKQKELLQRTPLESYSTLLVKGNSSGLRPTLYDLLAHKALDYFESDERYVTKPEYNFTLSDPALFVQAKDFVGLNIKTADTSSLHYKALRIYQELLQFHLNDRIKDALIDADIRRISFVNRNATMDGHDTLYKAALENVLKEYSGNKVAYQAGYLLAMYYNNLADQYNPTGDTTHRYERIKAERLLERIVADSAEKSESWASCYNLLQEIRKPFLSVITEKVSLPAESFRALVKYKNAGQIIVQLIPSSQNLKDRLSGYNADYWKILKSQKPLKQWLQTLPATADLQKHSVEIKIDPLPVGEYFLIVSDKVNIGNNDVTASASPLQISNIGYVSRDNEFFVLHRKTGEPLSGANIELFTKFYNSKNLSRTKTLGRYTANNHGFFNAKLKDINTYDTYMTIRYKGDSLSLDDDLYLYHSSDESNEAPDETQSVFFFTDRTLYRPGQTVLFKGILVREGSDADKTILANEPMTVYLYDANNEKRDSLRLTSNDYGSVKGSFILPSNLLNGQFSIRTKLKKTWSEEYFSVEEYKRPKFYVSFDTLKLAYKIGDSIKLTVNAKAFAGNDVGGAKISYTVMRSNQTYYSRKWLPQSNQQIAHGEGETADGSFAISFVAVPDKRLDSSENPVFNYTVDATVTDINGETHSETNTISVGYASLLLSASVPEKIPFDSVKKLSIATTNLEGEFAQAPLQLTFYKLLPEDRAVRERFWDEPDQFVMSKDEYRRYFPFDEYKNESDYKTWPKQAIDSFTTTSNEAGRIPVAVQKSLDAGHYLIRITATDKDGKEVKAELHTELFSPQKLMAPAFLWVYKPDGDLKPGEEAEVQLATSAQNIYLIKETDRQAKSRQDTTRFAYERLSNEQKSYRFTADEGDRGGYNYAFLFVKENRVYSDEGFVNVPWGNKELAVELTTFRDKTEPGAKETWKVKIKGEGGKKVAAEMLASMYDASLDDIKNHQWGIPLLWRENRKRLAWEDEDFSAADPEDKTAEVRELYYRKIYDAFLFDHVNSQPLWWLSRYRYQAYGYGFLEKPDSTSVVDPTNPSKVLTYNFTPPIIKRDENYRLNATAFDTYDMDFSTSKRRRMYLSNSQADVEGDWKDVNYYLKDGDGITDDMSPLRGNNYRKSNVMGFFNSYSDGLIQQHIAIQPRKNLAETAFFFPLLTTDENGDIEFSFTAPEALTKWKLQALAHTKDLAFGFAQKTVLTQKSLMVQPNVPRFVRQKDTLTLQAKIANLSATELNGEASFQLFDAATGEEVTSSFAVAKMQTPFSAKSGEATVVAFPVAIPESFNSSLTWRITASANESGKASFTDGEEASLPVLPNAVLLTETVPVVLKGSATKELKLEKLLQSAASNTIRHQSLTVEATSNPAWYVVQALPYLMEFPYECAEQTWNRFYANALASSIATSSPRIQAVFDKWRKDSSALASNLQKNEELKSALLQETPWLLEAKTEAEQKRNIALLFDANRINAELSRNVVKLEGMQKSNGAFPWFPNGPDNRYITQYILTGIGRLSATGFNNATLKNLQPVIRRALRYLDAQAVMDYKAAQKTGSGNDVNHLSAEDVQYLFMRSYFPNATVSVATQPAIARLQNTARTQWVKQSKQLQAMIALALYRNGDKKTAAAILASLKETAIVSEEGGMYWKEAEKSFYWQDAPIETMAVLVEAFNEINKDKATVVALQTWLIQNKQTTSWGNTKATADACFAVLMNHSSFMNDNASVNITLGAGSAKPLVFASSKSDVEEGTGYFKRTIPAEDINAGMGTIRVQTKTPTKELPVWVNVYWQYFEGLEKVTEAGSPLRINKEIFLEQVTGDGIQLLPVTDTTLLKRGDKVKIRLHVITDRNLEYVHLKDLRASCLEPLDAISGYRFQNGVPYYEETKDASTNFFFDELPKGNHLFEYSVYVAQSGNFSDGMASVRCMYAPQFSAHSGGRRVEVRN